MERTAAYDQIADWYETTFLGTSSGEDPLGISHAVRTLLGTADGQQCLEIGCGTGANAQLIRELGWKPLGLDVSSGMLRYARDRLPTALADARNLPLRTESVAAVVAVMVHTDMPRYPSVLREVSRILKPGGKFVHVGVHPCFCGGFADRGDPTAVLIRPGYLDTYWTKQSWTDQGLRDKVGAMHRPLTDLLHGFVDAGLTLQRFTEGGSPIPTTFAVRAGKPG